MGDAQAVLRAQMEGMEGMGAMVEAVEAAEGVGECSPIHPLSCVNEYMFVITSVSLMIRV